MRDNNRTTTLTLLEHVTKCLEFERRKHGKPQDFVENHIKAMNNYEFLVELSEALEAWWEERNDSIV